MVQLKVNFAFSFSSNGKTKLNLAKQSLEPRKEKIFNFYFSFVQGNFCFSLSTRDFTWLKQIDLSGHMVSIMRLADEWFNWSFRFNQGSMSRWAVIRRIAKSKDEHTIMIMKSKYKFCFLKVIGICTYSLYDLVTFMINVCQM